MASPATNTEKTMDEVEKLSRLFAGYPEAYGTYSREEKNPSKGGKLEIKATAKTITRPVTLELWQRHVEGEVPLGVIPILEDGTCHWAAIDYDKYQITHADIVKEINNLDLPLIVCRSKSGGAHIFAFFKEPQICSEVQHVMKSLAARLGLGNCEIFPKQVEVMYSRGDMGSWLNMPYYGDTDRRAVKKNGLLMTLKEFVSTATRFRCLLTEIEEDSGGSSTKIDDEDLDGGPPCLQYLADSGFPEGTRNNGLSAMAVFCKKKFGAGWKEKLAEFNSKYMSPPLPPDEVNDIIKSAGKKDYNYRCKDQPLCSYCNSQVCISRPYGVGDSDMFPQISGITVMKTEPPLWFVDVNGHRLEMSTETFKNYRKFQTYCMEVMFHIFPMLKQDTWEKILRDAMNSITVIEMPDDVSIRGIFRNLLEDFCHDMASPDDTAAPLLLGRVWFSDDENRYYFRLRDLTGYLTRHKFDSYTTPEITQRILDLGGGKKFFNVKKTGVNAWWVPEHLTKVVQTDLPEEEEKVF